MTFMFLVGSATLSTDSSVSGREVCDTGNADMINLRYHNGRREDTVILITNLGKFTYHSGTQTFEIITKSVSFFFFIFTFLNAHTTT